MRALNAFLILMITSTLAVSQTLPAPQAVTDPKQIASQPNAQVEPRSLSLPRVEFLLGGETAHAGFVRFNRHGLSR